MLKGGVLYWQDAGRNGEGGPLQMLLMAPFRQGVSQFAHYIPLAGHVAAENPLSHLLQRFYWPDTLYIRGSDTI